MISPIKEAEQWIDSQWNKLFDWVLSHTWEPAKQEAINDFKNFMHNSLDDILDIITVSYVCYVIYKGYKMFWTKDNRDITHIYISSVFYMILRLFWAVAWGVTGVR